jgi:hypothetical protein
MIHVNGGLPLRLARYQCRDKCDRKGHILVSKSARIFVISRPFLRFAALGRLALLVRGELGWSAHFCPHHLPRRPRLSIFRTYSG